MSDFIVGADVTGVEDAGKRVENMLKRLEKEAGDLTKKLKQIGDGSSGFKQLTADATKAEASVERIKNKIARKGFKMFENQNQVNAQLLQTERSLERIREKAAKAMFKRGDDSKSVNAMHMNTVSGSGGMGFMGGLIGGGMAGLGAMLLPTMIKGTMMAQKIAGSDAIVRHQARKQGLEGKLPEFDSFSEDIESRTGFDDTQARRLAAQAMFGGDRDSENIKNKVRMAIDFGAVTGRAPEDMIEAMNKVGGERKRAARELAAAAGIPTSEGVTANEAFAKIKEKVSGAAEEQYRAKGTIAKVQTGAGNALEAVGKFVMGAIDTVATGPKGYPSAGANWNQGSKPAPISEYNTPDLGEVGDKALVEPKKKKGGKPNVNVTVSLRSDANAPTQMRARAL